MAANDARVLAARLALIDRIRAVEFRLARAAQTEAARTALNEHLHTLGNAVQVVDLASAQLVKRLPDPDGLVADLRAAAAEAHATFIKIVALADPAPRAPVTAPFAATVRAALDVVRHALPVEVTVHDELLASTGSCRLAADELEVLAIAILLDAHAAPMLELALRERTIDGAPWFELIRRETRPGELSLDRELVPPSLLVVVDELARLGGGELSLAPGRHGHELVVALPSVPR
ncbi:MAG: hypothetical protein ABI467_11845 [Kofleriaceae bacterium]